MSRLVGHHHGDLRQALLDEAMRLLEAGDHTFSLRALARNAGVSAAAPYHHFGDRHGLLASLATEGFRSLRTALDLAVRSCDDAETTLQVMTREYVLFAVAHFAHYRVMFLPELDRAEHEELAETATSAFVRLVEAVGRVAPSHVQGVEEVRARAALIWSMAHGTALLAGEGAFEKVAVASNLADRVGQAALSIAGA